MFPWNYGFHSTPGQWMFIGVFYLVVLAIFATVLVAARRLLRDLRGNGAAAIQWQEEFNDLLSSERVCRHVFTSEFKDRTCDKAFDCRACETHAKLVARNSRASSASKPMRRCSTCTTIKRVRRSAAARSKPNRARRLTTGTTCPRENTTPSTKAGALGTAVTCSIISMCNT